jgi:hypothetical protein
MKKVTYSDYKKQSIVLILRVYFRESKRVIFSHGIISHQRITFRESSTKLTLNLDLSNVHPTMSYFFQTTL